MRLFLTAFLLLNFFPALIIPIINKNKNASIIFFTQHHTYTQKNINIEDSANTLFSPAFIQNNPIIDHHDDLSESYFIVRTEDKTLLDELEKKSSFILDEEKAADEKRFTDLKYCSTPESYYALRCEDDRDWIEGILNYFNYRERMRQSKEYLPIPLSEKQWRVFSVEKGTPPSPVFLKSPLSYAVLGKRKNTYTVAFIFNNELQSSP